jgi:importin subunit alpha-6/7
MSLRPSEREQMRKGNYKQTVDAEESRRRREGQMVDIRKAKREESLQKKRRDGFPAAGAVPPMGHSTALQQKVRRPLACSFWLRSDPPSWLGFG